MDALVIAPLFSPPVAYGDARNAAVVGQGFFFGRCARRRYHDAIAATSGDLCLRSRE